MGPALEMDNRSLQAELVQGFITKGQVLTTEICEAAFDEIVSETLITQVSELIVQLSARLVPETPPRPTTACPSKVNFDAVQYMNMLLSTVPVYDGDITKFVAFKRLFDRAVHDVPHLPDEIQSLISKLQGEIRSSIISSQSSIEDYTKIYETLCTENSGKYKLARRTFANRKTIPTAHKLDAAQLDAFLVAARAWIDSMKNVQTEDLSSFLLFEVLFGRLDSEIKEKLNREQMEGEDAVPLHKDLLDFVEKELKIAQLLPSEPEPTKQIAHTKQPWSSAPRSPHHANQSLSYPQMTARSNDSTVESAGPRSGHDFRCHYCKQQHFLYKCDQFKALPVAQKANFVRESGLCQNCFSHRHNLRNCTSKLRCLCGEQHHRWLHETEPTTKSQVQQ